MGGKRAMVLGIHSFLDGHTKVGIQYIAEGLVDFGWQVDYLSIPSSLFDFYGSERRRRLKRVWGQRQDKQGIAVKPGLTEFAFRTFYPPNKRFLRHRRLMDGFARLAPSWLKARHYDLLIHDITANILFLPLISANHRVLRLNDPPEGFAHDLHPVLITRFKQHIASLAYDEIWAVSEPLARYALRLNPGNTVVVLPNGVDDHFRVHAGKMVRHPQTAVYLGSIAQWVDLELLAHTARLLPDWQFDLYGPCSRRRPEEVPNLRHFPPVARKMVPKLLASYQVGLIPFRETSGRLAFVERPLKFYEYIGAGLGVASTDRGALREGMGNLAAYGNTPEGFAAAVVKAASEGAARTSDFNRTFVKAHSWKTIVQKMSLRLSTLQGG